MNVRNAILFLIFSLFASAIELCAQSKPPEMLEKELSQLITDSLKLKTMKEIAAGYRNLDPSKQAAFSYRGLALSKQTKDIRHEILFCRELGIFHKKAGLLDSALWYYEKALGLARVTANDSFYYATIISLGNLKKTEGAYKAGVRYFIEAITYYENRVDRKSQINYLTTLFNLANLNILLREYNKALPVLKKITQHPLSQSNLALLRGSYTNLLAVYVKIDEPDSALNYAAKAEQMALKTNNQRSLAHIYTNMGALYEQKKNFHSALVNFEKAKALYSRLNDNGGLARSENNLGNVYGKLGSFTRAENALLNAQIILEKSSDAYSIEHNYQALISLYTKMRDFEKAYRLQSALFQHKDSILNLESKKAMEEIEIQYEVRKKDLMAKNALKDKKLAELSSEKSRTYLAFGGAGGGLLLLTSSFYFMMFRSRKKRQMISMELSLTQKQLKAEHQYRQSEIKAIKAQMNPHFMFNTINSAQALILKGDKHEAYRYLSKFSELVRQNLSMSERHFVYFGQELHLINSYLQLEQLRFGKQFTYNITGTEALEDLKLPPLIIQPFLENAIKHGLLHRKGNKRLKIDFKLTEALTCTIEDNGIGREAARAVNKSKLLQHESFSTGAITRQLELLSTQHNTDFGFSITDLFDREMASGTRVILRIPYVSDHE
ncbi:MAG: histidine kinase [Roseivirga sp.]|nr:histidine kinase [Roseivirga sp.]